MSKINIAYIPVVGRGLQIEIICALHGIDTKMMMSKPMGEDFDKNTEAPFGTIPWLNDPSNGIELNDSLASVQYLIDSHVRNKTGKNSLAYFKEEVTKYNKKEDLNAELKQLIETRVTIAQKRLAQQNEQNYLNKDLRQLVEKRIKIVRKNLDIKKINQ